MHVAVRGILNLTSFAIRRSCTLLVCGICSINCCCVEVFVVISFDAVKALIRLELIPLSSVSISIERRLYIRIFGRVPRFQLPLELCRAAGYVTVRTEAVRGPWLFVSLCVSRRGGEAYRWPCGKNTCPVEVPRLCTVPHLQDRTA